MMKRIIQTPFIRISLLSSLALLTACGGSESGSSESGGESANNPPLLTELQAPNLAQIDLSDVITVGDNFLLDMMNRGGAASQCTSQPDLPAGLNIDAVAGSCIIHGSAIVVRGSEGYVISAINAAGKDSLSISLEVLAEAPQSPEFEVLNNNFFTWKKSSSIALRIENYGGRITRCTVTPVLPEGLSVIQQEGSCAILGIVGQSIARTNYVIVGTNQTGTTEQGIVIEIPENVAHSADGPDPADYDYVVTLEENRSISDDAVVLHSNINDPDSILQIVSSGFPNRLIQVQTDKGELLTNAADIDQLFRIFIDPATGIVEIHARKMFDFERDGGFFSIDIQLGTKTVKVLLRLYNVQKGTEAEPLFISTFNELVSFLKGQFVSDNVGFDLINLPVASGQNEAKLFVQLDRDIDASSTKQADKHWPGYYLVGQLDGGSHIIKGISLASRAHFLHQPNRFGWMNVRNLGLTDVEADSAIIEGQSYANITEAVFVEGVLDVKNLSRISAAPFQLSGRVKRVYSNMYIDVGAGRAKQLITVGAFGQSTSSPSDVHSGYSNGKIVTDPTSPMMGSFAGFQVRQNGGVSGPQQFISAVQFDVNNPPLTASSSGLRVGGFAEERTRIAPIIDSTDYTWRFIKDRNNSAIVRHVGNLSRDINNDGIADVGAQGTNWESAGMLEADAKNSSQYTGPWLTGDFDLTPGYIPVLKNMPYPHVHGASWMDAPDPGVAYQHNMYDYYLEDPRNP
ncbi:MAG: hypothetical protein ACI9OH_002613 [Oleispira sp.]|jgi:hypothetical protein